MDRAARSRPHRRDPREVADLSWADAAACKGRLFLFFAPHAERPPARARREAEAVRVCIACPVKLACRTHARAHAEVGVWGGETEAQRTEAGVPPVAESVPSVRRAPAMAP